MQKSVQNTAGVTFNFAELLKRIDYDSELLGELLTIFKRDYPRRLHSLREAIIGAEMKQVEAMSHSLKGMFSNLAMERAAAVAAHLEQMGHNRARAGLEDALALLEQEVADVLPVLDAYVEGARR
jgi:HPt (histidine-containing phosphotransfer) domain-containing protein